jgi:hypothetical protein
MKLLPILIISILFAACSALDKADDVIMSGQAEKVIFNIEYTEEERQIIKSAVIEYNKFHEEWKDFIENPVQLSAIGNEKLLSDYENIKNIYLSIENIVAENFGKYNEETQSQLLRYQDMALSFDRTMSRVKTVSDVATYGAIVAQIASKML